MTMSIKYLEVNNAYCIVFGKNLIDLDGQYLFESRQELKSKLKQHGLKLNGNNIIVA
jgi:hypothetical protein